MRKPFGIAAALLVLSTAGGVGLGSASVGLPAASEPSAQSAPGTFYWTVPDLVYEATIELAGAYGGSGLNQPISPPPQGLGARVTATIAVVPGEVLQVNVGGNGGNVLFYGSYNEAGVGKGGWNGGGDGGKTWSSNSNYEYDQAPGGGGATDVRRADLNGNYPLSSRILVAGGGGGTSHSGPGGGGGDGNANGEDAADGSGGGSTNCDLNDHAGIGGGGGRGGAQVAGGDGGFAGSNGASGSGGSTAQGGAGGDAYGCSFQGSPGGGGGGGYFGGGGGGSAAFANKGGGGGGGSSYAPAGSLIEPGAASTGAYAHVEWADPGETPTAYRPDGRIRVGKRGAWTGNDIYNADAEAQSVSKSKRRGHWMIFQVSLQNDGNVADRFTVQAGGRGDGFKIVYKRRAKKITDKIVAGTWRTPLLQPGEKVKLLIRVKPNRHAPRGSSTTRLMTITSEGNPLVRDAVMFIPGRK